MTSIADLWDEPLTDPPHVEPLSTPEADDEVVQAPRPSRPRSTLFLQSDSEDDAPQPARAASKPATERPDIDALFDDLDDEPDTAFQDIAPSLDLDALRRQADAVNYKAPSQIPHEILPSSSPGREPSGGRAVKGGKDGIKDRKRIPKLDEARLLSSNGFPALIRQAKGFKPKGKGHEAADLNRVLQVYQFWSHKLYPRMQFRDTTQRVERLCHSRRMHAAFRNWHDEAHGIKFHAQPINLTSDGEKESSSDEDAPAPQRDSNADILKPSHVPTAQQPAAPPKSTSNGFEDKDFDMDSAILEDEQRSAAAVATRPDSAGLSSYPAPPAVEADEDEAMWEELGMFADDPLPPPRSSSPPATEDMDEDMWEAVREAEEAEALQGQAAQESITNQAPGTPASSTAHAPGTNEEGWDEMYA